MIKANNWYPLRVPHLYPSILLGYGQVHTNEELLIVGGGFECMETVKTGLGAENHLLSSP